ncbi:MAG: SpoVA/SpoVAEb family sporulation membrane protein [Clostridia bacterium]|nr:SpoVA/SpoVAEb family sporulation membrane protein [Clostridia bacterium]
MNDWYFYLIVFAFGGLVCLIGQILVIKTKMTTARILVLFEIIGVALAGFGLFEPLSAIFGAGINVPIVGFGASLAKGAINAVKANGILGIFTGGLQATAGGIAAAVFFAFVFGIIFKAHTKKM